MFDTHLSYSYTTKCRLNYAVGGSKGPARPLGGVRGTPAHFPTRRRRRQEKESLYYTGTQYIERTRHVDI
jgi:hypothetical protein